MGAAVHLDGDVHEGRNAGEARAIGGGREGIVGDDRDHRGVARAPYPPDMQVGDFRVADVAVSGEATGFIAVADTLRPESREAVEQLRALGLEVAGFSCLTNWAAGIGDSPLSHEEVLETGKSAVAEFARLLNSALNNR